MKSLKLLLPVLGLMFLAASDGNALGSKSKTPPATVEFQITEGVAIEVDAKAEKDLKVVHDAYDTYRNFYGQDPKNKNTASKKTNLIKLCDKKCTGGLLGKVGGLCSKTGAAKACAMICPGTAIKNCLKSAKLQDQAHAVEGYEIAYDRNGIAETITAAEEEEEEEED